MTNPAEVERPIIVRAMTKKVSLCKCGPPLFACILVHVYLFCYISSIPSTTLDYTVQDPLRTNISTFSNAEIDGIKPKLLSTEDRSQDHLFVHIGKAGGSSIQQMVKKASEICDELNAKRKDDNSKNTTILRSQVCALATIPKDRVHLRARLSATDWYSKYHQFFVNVRDPIDRLVSWFNYEIIAFRKEPRWALANKTGEPSDNFRRLSKECFPGKNGFADMVTSALLSSKNKKQKQSDGRLSCNELARSCLRGDIMCYGHNYYNYETYLEEILRRKANEERIRIDVIRSEQSMEDFNRTVGLWTSDNPKELEQYAGVTPQVQSLYGKVRSINDYGGKKKKNSKPEALPPEARSALCKHICDELIVYKSILKAADNLHSLDIRESYDALDEHCRFQVDKVCGTTWTFRNIKKRKDVFSQPW